MPATRVQQGIAKLLSRLFRRFCHFSGHPIHFKYNVSSKALDYKFSSNQFQLGAPTNVAKSSRNRRVFVGFSVVTVDCLVDRVVLVQLGLLAGHASRRFMLLSIASYQFLKSFFNHENTSLNTYTMRRFLHHHFLHQFKCK